MVRPYQRKTGGGSFQLSVLYVYFSNEIPVVVIKKLRNRCAKEKLSENCVVDILLVISTLHTYAYSFICG